jgi:hypothetical protein
MSKKRVNIDAVAEEMGAVEAFARRDPAAGKPANLQTSKGANREGGERVNQQGSRSVGNQTQFAVRKFSSYLREDSIKALKMAALQDDRKDYEILQDAVDQYLKLRNRH